MRKHVSIRRRARGFTFIEIMSALAIIGALSSMAVPLAWDFRDQAISKAIRYQASAFRTAVDQARVAWRVRGSGGATTNLSGWGDGTSDFNANGYIMGTSWVSGALTHASCIEIWNSVFRSPAQIAAYSGASSYPGYQYYAYYGPGVGCVYAKLNSTGNVIFTVGGNITYLAYDPAAELFSPAGYIWSVDRYDTWTYFIP